MLKHRQEIRRPNTTIGLNKGGKALRGRIGRTYCLIEQKAKGEIKDDLMTQRF